MSRKPKATAAAPDVTTDAGAGDTSTAADQKQKRGKHKHAKGFGTLTLRGKTYQARWVVNGKIYVRSTKTGIKKDAEEKLREFTAEYRTKDEQKIVENLSARVQGIKSQIQRFEDGKPALSVLGAWSAYKASPTRPDSGTRTLRDYELQFGKFQDWLKANYPDAVELRNVSREIAAEFAAHIGGKFSPNTFNKYVVLLRCVWDTLKETARLTCNPWADIRRKVQIAHKRRELTIEELARVCGSVTGEMRVLFAVGMYTGLRLGDCALMDWGNVDLVRGVISVVPRKVKRHTNGRPVIVPIHKVLFDILTETPPEKRTGYVVPEIAATYLRNSALLSRHIQRVFAANGIATQSRDEDGGRASVEVGFHSLRHTFVSISANAGVPLALVQSIVGHSNPAMTLHYFHQNETALKNAVAALPDLTDADAPTEDAAAVRFRAFCAAWDALETDAERKRARDYIKARRRGV